MSLDTFKILGVFEQDLLKKLQKGRSQTRLWAAFV
jgi:hypothetical protein